MTESSTGASAGASSTSPRPARFGGGCSIGIGGLPHRDPVEAARFAVDEFDIATVPTLPRRSPAEAMIAQAVMGIPGFSLGQYGSMAVDPGQVVAGADVGTDLGSDAFVGLRAFLDHADEVGLDGSPVKWQFVGPVTLGVALVRAGLPVDTAFALAAHAVRVHVADIGQRISTRMPASRQLMLLDEPALVDLMDDDFPIPPDQAVDYMSTAMAAVPVDVTVGLHCCGEADLATMLAAGPRVMSFPAVPSVVDWAGYLQRFLDEGGIVIWGVVHTDGPVPPNADRAWLALSDLWCELVQRGCEPSTLRRQSLISPTCGLANHSIPVARRLARLNADVARRVKDQAGASRFALGA